MAAVDTGYAAWLKDVARYVRSFPASSTSFGDKAMETAILSPLSLQADAQAEANRQAAFLAGPLARDRHVVPGLRRDLIGRTVTIKATKLGYQGGATVFVIGAAESVDNYTTTLTVLKRLAP